MDTTVMLGPLKFSLRATILVIILHLSIASPKKNKKKHYIATITHLRSLKLLIAKTLPRMWYFMNRLTFEFWTRRAGELELDRSHGTSSPPYWQQLEEQAPKHVGWMMCFLLMTVYIYIYIYMHSLGEICYRTYIYIHKECRSVLVNLHPITDNRTFLGSARFLGCMPLFVFFCLPIASCSLMKSLILGCLWPLVSVLNIF